MIYRTEKASILSGPYFLHTNPNILISTDLTTDRYHDLSPCFQQSSACVISLIKDKNPNIPYRKAKPSPRISPFATWRHYPLRPLQQKFIYQIIGKFTFYNHHYEYPSISIERKYSLVSSTHQKHTSKSNRIDISFASSSKNLIYPLIPTIQ